MTEPGQAKIFLNVLCLEDDLNDAKLIDAKLTESGFLIKMDIASGENEYLSLLRNKSYDIILSDYSLPGFDVHTALKMVLEVQPHVPFICVSGTINEDKAVELLEQGATDYILKDRPGRLAFAVRRALEGAEKQRQNKFATEELLKAKNRAEASEAILRSALENSQAGIAIAEYPSRKIIYVNSPGVLIRGRSLDEVANNISVEQYLSNFKFFHFDGTPLATEEVPIAKATFYGEKSSREFIIRRDNNEDRYVLATGTPIYNASGVQTAAIAVFLDITDKKRIEFALKENQENLRNNENFLKETQVIANLGTYMLDIKSGRWKSSDVLNKIFGIDADYDKSFEGWASVIHPEWQKKMTDYFINEVVGNKTQFNKEYIIIRKTDNTERWVHGIGNLKFDENDQPIMMIGTIQDITERKKAEQILHESDTKFKELFEANMDGIAILSIKPDPRAITFLDMNGNSAKMLGYTKEEMLKMSPISLEKHVTKEDIEKRIEDLKLKGFSDFETNFRHKNGNDIVVEITAKVINFNNQPAVMNIVRDITKRKQTELALMEAKEKAEESDRLKSAFLTNMSHEIRTPMNGILGFAELLKEPDLSSDEQQTFFQIIQNSGERMLNTINSIIDISKIESGLIDVVIEETNINEKIEFLYKFFKPEVERKGLQFIYNTCLPAEDAVIRTDNEKVDGVLINLIKNAIKFTYVGSIEFGYEKKGAFLEFYVKDTGVGIPKNQKEIIFERFRQGSYDLNRFMKEVVWVYPFRNLMLKCLVGRSGLKAKKAKVQPFILLFLILNN